MLEKSGATTPDEEDAFLQRALSICGSSKESYLLASCYLCDALHNAESKSTSLASIVKKYAPFCLLLPSYLSILSAAREVPKASVIAAGGLLTAASNHEILSKDLFPALSRSVKRNAEVGTPCLIAAFRSIRVDASRYLSFLVDTCMHLFKKDTSDAENQVALLIKDVLSHCSDSEAVVSFVSSLLKEMDASRAALSVKRQVYLALSAILRALDSRVMQKSDLKACGRDMTPILLAAYKKEANAANKCFVMDALTLAVQLAQQVPAEVLSLALSGAKLSGNASIPSLYLLSCVVAIPDVSLSASELLPLLDSVIQCAAARPFLNGREGILAMASVIGLAIQAGCAVPDSAVKATDFNSFLFMHRLYTSGNVEEREATRWCQQSVIQLLEQAMKTHVFDAEQECRVIQLLFDLVVSNAESVGRRQCRNRRFDRRGWRCCAIWRAITSVCTRCWSRSSAG